jgi:ubiquinone/menaquinone biosynthesis C-methylase UbiE
MSQSVSDDDALWRQFAEARMKEGNLNDHLDLPSVFETIPQGKGSKALDLGCGLGQSSFRLAEQLGYDVLAVDASSEMLTHARRLYSGVNIQWIECSFDQLEFPENSFQLIVACLSFHFVERLDHLLKRCSSWLCGGGLLVFSVRHPIRTCNPTGELSKEGMFAWRASDYFQEGPREFNWLGAKCINHHRTIGTYAAMLSGAGMSIERLIEPSDSAGAFAFSEESRSVPFFLTIASRKPIAHL